MYDYRCKAFFSCVVVIVCFDLIRKNLLFFFLDFFAFFHFILHISLNLFTLENCKIIQPTVCLDHIMALKLTANNVFVLHLHRDHVQIKRKLKVLEAPEHSPVGLLRFFSKITLRREPSMADSSK